MFRFHLPFFKKVDTEGFTNLMIFKPARGRLPAEDALDRALSLRETALASDLDESVAAFEALAPQISADKSSIENAVKVFDRLHDAFRSSGNFLIKHLDPEMNRMIVGALKREREEFEKSLARTSNSFGEIKPDGARSLVEEGAHRIKQLKGTWLLAMEELEYRRGRMIEAAAEMGVEKPEVA